MTSRSGKGNSRLAGDLASKPSQISRMTSPSLYGRASTFMTIRRFFSGSASSFSLTSGLPSTHSISARAPSSITPSFPGYGFRLSDQASSWALSYVSIFSASAGVNRCSSLKISLLWSSSVYWVTSGGGVRAGRTAPGRHLDLARTEPQILSRGHQNVSPSVGDEVHAEQFPFRRSGKKAAGFFVRESRIAQLASGGSYVVLVCAYCGKSKVNTSGSVPVFSMLTPPLSSAD